MSINVFGEIPINGMIYIRGSGIVHNNQTDSFVDSLSNFVANVELLTSSVTPYVGKIRDYGTAYSIVR